MSRVDTGKTKCPCGQELIFQVKKPNYLTPTVSKLICKFCGSRFLMHVEVDKDQKIPKPSNARELYELACKPFQRKYKHRFELIRLSAAATKRSKSVPRQIASMIVETVSKKDTEPEF